MAIKSDKSALYSLLVHRQFVFTPPSSQILLIGIYVLALHTWKRLLYTAFRKIQEKV